MVVCGASAWMEVYHDRMPVILEPAQFDAWLDGSMSADALKPASEKALREWLVSPRMNRTGFGDEDASTIAPIGNLGALGQQPGVGLL